MERATPRPHAAEAQTEALDWNEIYLDLAPRVYNYFRFRLGQEREVEDLTSRTFEKAWTARGRYRRDLAGFSTWLFTFANIRRIESIVAALDTGDSFKPDRCDNRNPLNAFERAAVPAVGR